MDVIDVVAELKPIIYETAKSVVDDTGKEMVVSRSAIQLNYVVSVGGDAEKEVTLNAEEHSECCWATEAMADTLNITALMREVIREAFRWVSR